MKQVGKLSAGWLVAISLMAALLTPPASAFDPALNTGFLLNGETGLQALSAEERARIAGVQVRDVTELGRLTQEGARTQPEDLWARIRSGFAIPDLDTPLVIERQEWYASRPQQLKLLEQRSRRYLYHIVEEIERRGMPTELALLPMVESAFNPMAESRARASGLWQFIPSTGKSYNLEQNWWYDARRDIVASTNAALDYLQTLYAMHGDWHLALASYNWGENAVLRAVDKARRAGQPTDYANLAMPRETRYYVPKLQALKNIVAAPQRFGLELDPIPNEPYFVIVALSRDIDLDVAAKLAQMPLPEFLALNPGHNRPVIESSVAPRLILPADRADLFVRNLEAHDKPLTFWRSYVVNRGEKLEKIAAAHAIPAAELRSVNGLKPRATVSPGQQIIVPIRGSHPVSEWSHVAARPAGAPAAAYASAGTSDVRPAAPRSTARQGKRDKAKAKSASQTPAAVKKTVKNTSGRGSSPAKVAGH